MNVLVTDGADEQLVVEHAVLGNLVTTCDQQPNDILVAIVHQTIVDEPFLDRFPNLRGVVRQGVGFDKVDLRACEARNVLVANVPDYCTTEVADTAMAMILDLVRGIREIEFGLRNTPESWQSLALSRIRRTSSLTLGVVGAGRIGSAVLARAANFGFHRIFVDPAVDDCCGAERINNLKDLLGRADIVSLHTPANEQTNGFVDADFLDHMKHGAMLINTARGRLIRDEQLLLNAVRCGKLAGIALDVLACEPPNGSVLFDAWRIEDPTVSGKVRITPHVAFHSQEAAIEVRRMAAEEAAAMLCGKPPRNGVSHQGST